MTSYKVARKFGGGGWFRSHDASCTADLGLCVQVLDISYNGISAIQPADLLSGLHHLNTLYVEGNLIHTLADSAVEQTRVLAKLVISGNQLTAPDAQLLYRLEYLEEIDAGNNPFECTCALLPFLAWTNTTPVLMLGYEDANR